MMDIALTGRPHSWRAFFYALLDADEGDENQARYAVYAARAGEYLIKIPVSATQTVQHYLRQVGSERALEATRDHRQAERARSSAVGRERGECIAAQRRTGLLARRSSQPLGGQAGIPLRTG